MFLLIHESGLISAELKQIRVACSKTQSTVVYNYSHISRQSINGEIPISSTKKGTKTCLLGSNRIVRVCTRKGSKGGSSGFTGRKDENGTLTYQWKLKVRNHIHKSRRKCRITRTLLTREKNSYSHRSSRNMSDSITLQKPTFVLNLAK